MHLTFRLCRALPTPKAHFCHGWSSYQRQDSGCHWSKQRAWPGGKAGHSSAVVGTMFLAWLYDDRLQHATTPSSKPEGYLGVCNLKATLKSAAFTLQLVKPIVLESCMENMLHSVLQWVKQLVSKGNMVIASCRNPSEAVDLQKAGVAHVVKLDVSDPASIQVLLL